MLALSLSSTACTIRQPTTPLSSFAASLEQRYALPIDYAAALRSMLERIAKSAGPAASVKESVGAVIFQCRAETLSFPTAKLGVRNLAKVAAQVEPVAVKCSDSVERFLETYEDTSLEGLAMAIDPDAFIIRRSNASSPPGGVGVELTRGGRSSPPGPLRITKTYPDGPANRAGIRSGDHLVAVDSVPVRDLEAVSVVELLRGTIGSTVTLTVARGTGTHEFSIQRELILAPLIRQSMVRPGIGYIRIQVLQEGTADAVGRAWTDLEHQGARALILDLRGNEGGLVTATFETADLFADEGLVMLARSHWCESVIFCRGPQPYRFFATRETRLDDPLPPLVLLVDRFTAAGAEVVAAAVQRGPHIRVLGERTRGAGRIQTLVPLTDDLAVRMTTAFLHLDENGPSLTETPILPDEIIEYGGESDNAVQRASDLLAEHLGGPSAGSSAVPAPIPAE